MNLENSSGKGPAAIVPAEVDRWNWGAFLLPVIWAIGNNTLRAPLTLVPPLGGAMGSAAAWRYNKWDSVEQFKAVQHKWTRWALVLHAALLVLSVCLLVAIVAGIKSSEAYKLGVAKVEASPEASQFLGKPISAGIPMGSFSASGSTGTAELSFSVDGPKGKGTVYLEARKKLGLWQIEEAVLEEQGTGNRIDLNK
jgi:hypothetical protein